jgi:hypothetical protein
LNGGLDPGQGSASTSAQASPYAAPTAPLGEPTPARGSLLAGFVLGWVALFAGGVAWLGWAMLMVIAGANDPDAIEWRVALGVIAMPLLPVAAGGWFWRRGKRDTAIGIGAAALVAVFAIAGLATWPWLE